jgi:hypothetical protein
VRFDLRLPDAIGRDLEVHEAEMFGVDRQRVRHGRQRILGASGAVERARQQAERGGETVVPLADRGAAAPRRPRRFARSRRERPSACR